MKMIGKQLIKLKFVKKAVEDYKARRQKQKDDRLFARIMYSGQRVRNFTPMRLEPWDTLTVVGEGGTYHEVLGGKIVETGWIDSTTWGRVY